MTAAINVFTEAHKLARLNREKFVSYREAFAAALVHVHSLVRSAPNGESVEVSEMPEPEKATKVSPTKSKRMVILTTGIDRDTLESLKGCGAKYDRRRGCWVIEARHYLGDVGSIAAMEDELRSLGVRFRYEA